MTMSLRSISLAGACLLWTSAAVAQQGGRAPAPPRVAAFCEPCYVEVGKTSHLHAYAKDPARKPLTIKWTATGGTIAGPTDRTTTWTAPTQTGSVQLTVVVDNGSATATDTISLEVVPTRSASK